MTKNNSTNPTLMNAVLVGGTQHEPDCVEVFTRARHSVLRVEGPPPLDQGLGLAIEAGLACIGMTCTDDAPTPTYTLLAFVPFDEVEYLACIPDQACPVAGVVERFRGLVAEIKTPALRRFLNRVFGIPEVFLYFFTAPASLRHHHSHSGGLALHSVNASEYIQRSILDPTEREIGITRQLVHDVGKIWSYERGRLTEEANQLGHDAVGLVRIFPLVEELIEEWPRGGRDILSMLLRSSVNPDFPRCPPLFRIACAADFYDAHRDGSRRGNRRSHSTKHEKPTQPPTQGSSNEDEYF